MSTLEKMLIVLLSIFVLQSAHVVIQLFTDGSDWTAPKILVLALAIVAPLTLFISSASVIRLERKKEKA